jgi:hydrogenase maturation protein HypF
VADPGAAGVGAGAHPAGGPAEAGTPPAGVAVVRRRLRVTGTVQGVGFRPFVYRHAVRLGLAGHVGNDSAGVLVEVEGPPAAVDELARLLASEPPPLARVQDVSAETLAVAGEHAFSIAGTDGTGDASAAVSVDTGTCAECLAEVDDPGDRRYRYPFTNCTNCGPRYTIVTAVPYDRPATTMAAFDMCVACRKEYADPADRRFHAQPNACPECGPQLWWRARGADAIGGGGEAALGAAVAVLMEGGVAAVKGVGGYHLAADATSTAAVNLLRQRKSRDDKPFAVMVPDVDTAAALVHLDAETAALLSSPRRPIVLAPRRPHSPVAPGVAPGLRELGVMLPYSPLHHLLLSAVNRPLVMTSGNLSDEPIAYADDDAVTRLGPLVDGILGHNRPIHIRCDDSVVRVTVADPPHGETSTDLGTAGSGAQMIRRSRGYAPEPIRLPEAARRPLLAVGAELKSTVAVAKGTTVVASHHLGDLEHLPTYRSFRQAILHLQHICGVHPRLVAHDLHPEYLSTKHALELDLPALGVQHHHAHVASCLVDHGRTGPVVGLAFDGLGYGPDGCLWGGEVLVADLSGYHRAGHLAPVSLPGGSAAIREPWRMAMAWLHQACGADAALEAGERLDPRARSLLAVLEGGGGQPVTTSAGRLFDAVAALVCGRALTTYEGQAAIELEALGVTVPAGAVAPYPVSVDAKGAGGLVIDPAPLVASVAAAMTRGSPPAEVAAAFHEGLAVAAVEAAARVASDRGLDTVALTGGVFQNVRLSALVAAGLRRRGLHVLVHRHVPPNDGGISIGQAAIAAAH